MKHRARRRLGAVVGAVLALALIPVGAALAAYNATTAHSSKAAPEAVELSGLVASPTYPHWYWAQSDVWKSDDTFSACTGLDNSELSRCQQIQRSRLWALRLDPVTHKVLQVRSFSLADPEWALDPHVAQNNDWEELTAGPVRTDEDGTTTRNLIIAATGDALQNRVVDASGHDITCDTRRLIELAEPDLADPTSATWTPWKIYDIKNYVGMQRITSCNVEALVTAEDPAGTPRGYMITKAGQKILSRSLEVATGRDPDEAFVPPGTGTPYDPTVTYVGLVKGAGKLKFTAAATNGADVTLQVPKTSAASCQVLTWPIGANGLASALMFAEPTLTPITCTNAEGLTYVPDLGNPAVASQDLMLVGDTGDNPVIRYWYLPWVP